MTPFRSRAAVASAALCAVVAFVGCQVAVSQPSAKVVRSTPAPAGPVTVSTPSEPAKAAESDAARTHEPSPSPSNPASLQPSPVPVVELRGNGSDLGAEHGSRLAGEIRTLHAAYLRRFIRGDLQRFLALSAADRFRSQLPPEYKDEVAALATGSGIDGRDAMLGQCFLDLVAMTACSTVALPPEASPDGVVRLGRNLDFPGLNVADKYTTLFVYHPEGRYAFVSVGWPGLIGVLSGMNEHGLTLANMEVTRAPRLPQAMPYTLLYRTVLEQCRTTEEAIELLKRTPRQTSNNLIIVDATGDRAVAEISPEGVAVRRADDSALISTNHRRGTDNASPGRCRRYDSLCRASERHFGRIDERRIESMLAAVSPGRQTLQSMVFEPSNRVIYLSAGADATRGTFHRIELAPYFQPQ